MSDLYIVLIVALIAWGGIFFYLLRIDLQIRKLEKKDEE